MSGSSNRTAVQVVSSGSATTWPFHRTVARRAPPGASHSVSRWP
jgi:hypothetical protein